MRKSDPKAILKILKEAYPEADCALVHDNPLQLLLATILSAQCTDKRVNIVTRDLFKKYKSARDFARAGLPDIENVIRSTGFYKQKAKSIKETCRILEERHGGKVPRTMEELTALRGVARKTANVVLGTAYGIAAGVVVDTHVMRLSKRLGLTKHDDPVKIERDLMKAVPQGDWIWFSHALISHGRQICKAPNPQCQVCPLNRVCPSSRA